MKNLCSHIGWCRLYMHIRKSYVPCLLVCVYTAAIFTCLVSLFTKASAGLLSFLPTFTFLLGQTDEVQHFIG